MEPVTLLLTVITVCICLYYFILDKLFYFKRRKIPYLRPIPLLGNMMPFVFQRLSMVDNIRKVYNLFPDAKYFGFYEFMTPIYVIRDPDLIAEIAVKNFDNFCDHRNFINGEIDPIASKNLFSMRGDHWREMRKLLSPSFTSGKIKMMFELMCQCADNLANFLAIESGKTGKAYDMKDVLSRYANDVVATCAFGISVDSFKQPNNEFFHLVKELMMFNNKSIKLSITKHFPTFAKLLGIQIFDAKAVKFFSDIIADTVRIRNERGIVRPDMIHLMMENKDKDSGRALNVDEMTGQAFLFLIGGFDSISSYMCFLVHEVGINSDVQNKLKAEIDDVLRQTGGKPTYDVIKRMKYMDAVIQETLRLYPLSPSLDRLCVKEFELPPATPDGEPITVKPGDNIWMPAYSLQRDPKYYSQPEKFDPDRFLNGEIDNSVYIPFGAGPRYCIAKRFALMDAKIMLFYLLWHCDLESDAKTNIPMKLSKKAFFMAPESGFLKLRARKSATPIACEHLSNGRDI